MTDGLPAFADAWATVDEPQPDPIRITSVRCTMTWLDDDSMIHLAQAAVGWDEVPTHLQCTGTAEHTRGHHRYLATEERQWRENRARHWIVMRGWREYLYTSGDTPLFDGLFADWMVRDWAFEQVILRGRIPTIADIAARTEALRGFTTNAKYTELVSVPPIVRLGI